MRTLLRFLAALALVSILTATARAGDVALTFDDGPHPTLTPRLLKMLDDAKVKATFCVVGELTAKYPHIVRRIAAEGHELCNHSWNHRLYKYGGGASQIERTDAAIRSAAGLTPAILRAPGGASGALGNCYGGRPFVNWNVDTHDYKYRDAARVARVAGGASGIVLMHDIHATTVAAVPGMINALKARGARFVHASALWRSSCGTVARAK